MTLIRASVALLAFALIVPGLPATSSAAAMDDITAANKAGKTVFLVLTDAAGKNLKAAREAAAAASKQTPNSAVVELNRSDPAQAAAVRKYRVAGAPVPLVVVIAQNGVAAGASLVKRGAVKRLVSLVPTPAKADYLRVLSYGQTAVILFSHKGMKQQSALFAEASKVVEQGKGKITTVVVDMSSKAEAPFLREWKIDPASATPTVVVMNPKGQTLGRLTGVPTAKQLIETSKKRPCCGNPSCKGCN